MYDPSASFAGPVQLFRQKYPYPQAGVTVSQTSFLPPPKAVQPPMVQAKPHQHEDLNHLIGKAKPHQAIVRNRACLGEVGPQQRQCC